MPMQVMTELLDQLRAPALPVTLREISQVILPVSGTLLGLVYAGLIYWFQGALERLTYASELLEDVVSINGKIVLDLLVGASLVSLFGLFGLTNIASVAFWVFAIFIITDVARVTAEYGELETISTSKFIPEAYGSTRRFLRKIRNAGPIHWFGGLILLGITTGYPIWISSAGGFSWRMQTNSLIVFLLVTLAFGLVRVRSLLLEALETRNTLKERLATSDEQAARRLEDPEVEWDGVKKRIERKILEERLKALGVRQPFEHPELKDQADCQMHDLERTPALKGPPWVKEDGSCHLNLQLPLFESAQETRQFIFEWTRRILTEFVRSKSEVRFYTLSWFRKFEDDDEHFGMFRSTKSDVLTALDEAGSDLEFVKNLSGVFVADAIVKRGDGA